jgi:hypothetical protein
MIPDKCRRLPEVDAPVAVASKRSARERVARNVNWLFLADGGIINVKCGAWHMDARDKEWHGGGYTWQR